MPGQRRGGRTRATLNRRSILAARMMAVLAGCSMASPKERLSKLINDTQLPADIRMAIAQKAFADRNGSVRRPRRAKSEIRTSSAVSAPAETMSRAERDALLGIVSDASAQAKPRRKAAVKLATYFLPKKAVNKRWQFTADGCGFAINAEITREYRAIYFELAALKGHPNRDFPEIAQKVQKLQARIDAIRQRLQRPCPSRYGNKEIPEDMIRLETLARKREAGFLLSTEEDAEEAHRLARLVCHVEGPEQTAQHYRTELQDADLRWRKNRFFKVGMTAPLSLQQRGDLALLRWLYPRPNRNSHLTVEAQADADANKANRHPSCFGDEEPAADGYFYPHDSILRPASADEPEFVEFADVPKYCIYKLGQPPIFTDELPIDPPNDKSAPTSKIILIPRSF
jgi:hypothetical protein